MNLHDTIIIQVSPKAKQKKKKRNETNILILVIQIVAEIRICTIFSLNGFDS